MTELFASVQFAPVQRCDRCGRFVRRGLWSWVTHETEECPVKAKPKPVTQVDFRHSWYFPPMGPKCKEALEEALDGYFEEHQNRMKL